MTKTLLIYLLAILSTGCSMTPQEPADPWVANFEYDEFTDETKCTVTTGSKYIGGSVYTYNSHFYPFIEKHKNEIWFGVKSGGKVPIPVGNIQVRIDRNDAWEILSSETPYESKGQTNFDIQNYVSNVSEEQRQQIVANYETMMAAAQKSTLPYTATTGDKAESIIKQMLSGDRLIYRVTGFNHTNSSTGEYSLGADLKEALKKCAITI